MQLAFDTFVAWYAAYGYLLLFLGVLLEDVGVPVPGETAVLAAGFLASHAGGAFFDLGWVIALAFAAAVVGDNVGYWLGHRLARPRIHRGGGVLWLTPQAFQRAEVYFERYGALTVFVARFVTGLRVVAALAAGTLGMPWSRFFLANAAGALVWASTIALLGYGFGRSWQWVHPWLGWGSWIILAIVVLGIGLRHLWVHLRQRGRKPPRATRGELERCAALGNRSPGARQR